jgi:F-type H+-transporting ATPase subunit gamma
MQGKKGVSAFRYLGFTVARSYLLVSDKPSYTRAEEIGTQLMDRYVRGDLDEAYLVYSQFKWLVSQVPKVEKLLPLTGLEAPAKDGAKPAHHGGAGYLFHPGPEQILSELLPSVVKLSIFTAMLDSNAGEHSARRVAMKNATEAADEMIKRLTQWYNRVRQSKITQEISEIVGGAEAL